MIKLKNTASTAESPAIALIAAERKRQITEEGFSVESDTFINNRGELARAAACYALPKTLEWIKTCAEIFDKIWPWDIGWWKPSEDRKRDIIKACALLVAEYDRISVIEAK
jgi:hypothetical protein